MRNRGCHVSVLTILLALSSNSSIADGPAKPPVPPKKILVELYTSQGSRSSPPASDLMGRLSRLGYGPDRVVLLNFHVDSCNKPWVDSFSDPVAGRRQLYYNEVLRRRDLVFTPLMMIDGREPVIGSEQSSVLATLAKAGREEAEVTLDLTLDGTGSRRSLRAKVAGRSSLVVGRELLVGVALAEDHASTKVLSGENAGRTLHEHQVVRQFIQKSTKLDATKPQTVIFPVELPESPETTRFRLTAFVQDRQTGAIHQAESIPWPSADQEQKLALNRNDRRPKVGRVNTLTFFDFPLLNPQTSIEELPSCPDCGTPFSAEYLITLPPGYTIKNRFNFPDVPLPKC